MIWKFTLLTAFILLIKSLFHPSRHPIIHRLRLSSMECFNLFRKFEFKECYWHPKINLKITIVLNAKSPKALVMANCPPTLPCKMHPPQDLNYQLKFTLFFFVNFNLKLYDLQSLFLRYYSGIKLPQYHLNFLQYIFFYYFANKRKQDSMLSQHLMPTT